MREIWMRRAVAGGMCAAAGRYQRRWERRRFNYIGDTTWIHGSVTGKRIVGQHAMVDLGLSCTNQRGETTTPGTATVILPSRELGPVVLPTPPAPTLSGMVAKELERFRID